MKARLMSVFVLLALGAAVFAAPMAPSGAAPAGEKFPEKKWFMNGKGYAEALAIQEKTGADLIVYFANYGQSDEKGLCHWFEKRVLQTPTVEKYLRSYIKVKFMFPLSRADNEIAGKFGVNKTPAVFVAPQSGFPKRVAPFHWQNKNPKPVLPDEFVADVKSKSSAPSPASE